MHLEDSLKFELFYIILWCMVVTVETDLSDDLTCFLIGCL